MARDTGSISGAVVIIDTGFGAAIFFADTFASTCVIIARTTLRLYAHHRVKIADQAARTIHISLAWIDAQLSGLVTDSIGITVRIDRTIYTL